MKTSKRQALVQCEDCGEEFPLTLFLKHWHDDEIPGIAIDTFDHDVFPISISLKR